MAVSNTNLLHTTHFSDLTKWSTHDAIFENIKNRFPLVPLSKILKRIKEPTTIEDEKIYKRITVRLYGQGVLKRDELQGKDIGTKRQFIAHAGQLIISRIDARNGAFGIVPNELEGAIVTNDFWLFDVHNALPEYLMLVLSSELFQQYWQTQSSGTTNRQRISEDNFLDARITLPNIEMQKKLFKAYSTNTENASFCDAKAQKLLEEIRIFLFDELGIFEKSVEKNCNIIDFIHYSTLYRWGVDKNSSPFPYQFRKYKAYSFNQKPIWVNAILRGKSPRYSAIGENIILNQKCNRMDYIDLSFAKTVDADWFKSLDRTCLTKENDILINSTGEGTIGRASLVKKCFEGLAYDSHMLLLRVNTEVIEPQLIVDLINSSFGQKQIELYKSAQATKQTELGIDNMKKLLFPLPELNEQKRISAGVEEKKKTLRVLRKKSDLLREQAKKEFEEAVFSED